MSEYVYTSPRGIKHTITQRHVEEAFRTLLQAKFSFEEARDKALDYVIHQINVDEIPDEDLLYNSHNQQESNAFCGLVAGRLASFMTKEEQEHKLKKEQHNYD